MSLNFVRIKWRVKHEVSPMELIRTILNDRSLSWGATGLGVYLVYQAEGVRFPNTAWDGTMDALNELRDKDYLHIIEVKDAELH